MRKWVVVSAIMTMFLAVACAEAVPASAPAVEPDPVATSIPLTPTELLQKSFDRMKDVRTFSADLEAEMTTNGEVFTGSADVAVAENGNVDISAVVGQQDFQLGVGVKVIQPDVFISIPLLGWHRIDGEAMAQDEGVSTEDFDLDKLRAFITSEIVPWHLVEVTSLGTEDINGVETEHLSVDADLVEVWRFVQDSGILERLKAEFAPDEEHGTEGMEDIEAELSRVNVSRSELWIDSEGIVRKVALEASFEDEFSATLTIELNDYDTEIIVEPPSQYTDGLPSGGLGGFEGMIPGVGSF